MSIVSIYQISISHVEQLQSISKLTFIETFADSNSTEDMQNYLDNEFTIDKLQAELLNPNSQFYFAAINQQIIGYLKLNLNQSQTELKDQNSLEIERIYVLAKFQGKRVGKLLLEKALEIAVNKKVNYMWLGVWENNLKAIQFYTQNGFITFDKHSFQLGNESQTDIMMKKVLKSN